MEKILIITDTFISGTPVGQGAVLEVDESIARELVTLKRAVPFAKATPEQKALIPTKKESK